MFVDRIFLQTGILLIGRGISKSSMSDLLRFVLPVQDKLVVRRSSVIRFAVNVGIDVNRDTTSKDTIVSSGSILSSFMCWRNLTVLNAEWVYIDNLFKTINSTTKGITFTMEKEKERKIAFLDIELTRTDNGSMETQVHRKNTHADQILNYSSNHPTLTKPSAALKHSSIA